MTRRVCVYGLWHLGCVVAASLAEAGSDVVGLDRDERRVADLRAGRTPIAEPGLDDLIRADARAGRLTFTADPAEALRQASILLVAFDTPIGAEDRGDASWVRAELDAVRVHVSANTLVLLSSQVPVGFTRALERAWRGHDHTLRFAYSPENLRLGRALETFRHADRVVVGLGDGTERADVEPVYSHFTRRIEWMSLESAEMTKHAINAFLALSVTYANELARIGERVGADAMEVERGLRGDARVGTSPYLSPGAPVSGGTLLRDVASLKALAADRGVDAPLVAAIQPSNAVHATWVRERVVELTAGVSAPRVALLGLTYKPDTNTLRGSAALEAGRWLASKGIDVVAFDPAITELPSEAGAISLATSVEAALSRADVAILATPWPQFSSLTANEVVGRMRRAAVVDQAGFLRHLADDARVTYVRLGRPRG